jgi:hypothetical protein
VRKPALASAVSACLLAGGLAAPPAAAVKLDLVNLPGPSGYDLLSADYDPAARRLTVRTQIGNLECAPQGEIIPPGTYSLRLDGRNYRLGLLPSTVPFRYLTATGRIETSLPLLDELTSPECKSSGVSAANLRLRIDDEPSQAIGQGVVYRTGSPRRVEVRVTDPLICFDFGSAPGNLRLDLTDANGDLWQLPAISLASYAHSTGLLSVRLPSTSSCFGFNGQSGQSVATGGGPGADALFSSGFEIEEIYPDLRVTITELPSVLENVFRYRIDVTNHAIGPAENIRVRDFFPKVGSPSFVDGIVNWDCTASGTGASCGVDLEGGGRVDLVGALLPAHLPGSGSPPRLRIEVERTLVDYVLGQPLAIQAAATTSPPGLPDRNRADNSAVLLSQVSEPQGPIARDDAFQTDQDTAVGGNLFADNGHGPDGHAAGQSFFVARVNGAETNVGLPVALAPPPAWGSVPATVTVQANGTMSFDPGEAFIPVPRNQSSEASFTYTLRDGDGLESTATVTITVAGLNDPPVAGDMEFDLPVTSGNVGGTIVAPGMLGGSWDPDGDPLSVVRINGQTFTGGQLIVLPSGASLFPWSDGTFSYARTSVSVGQFDSFDIVVSDGLLEDVARVTINYVAPP